MGKNTDLFLSRWCFRLWVSFDGNFPSFSVFIKCDFDYIFLSMCIFYLVTFVNHLTLKAKTHVGSILSIHAIFFIYYCFSIFVQIQHQLWQDNTETLKIMRQNNFFMLEKGANLLVVLAALQQFEEYLHLVCIFPEAVDHAVVSPHSLKHIGRDEAIGCLFRTLWQQTSFT